mmetsp:Transcript_11170/g.33334  ORF Transcript_11170/g.33334 Transcript_11170/m.33334 type:complete len:145 (+) Transcript_11170:235-669(+)|eukprot:CAMPEP_0119268888 /NCGR_PEP_ID=MMETSP1329-20130426/6509_1 /TAXON_ID=114041 /ORGANISM="Genus nov. species nov., Strain RCC1024" /LENGTH=144 /DNA_ID=CAMNT_0007268873 /DNA_START=161 /DNA_END=595 /DNA_ORIENTATION=-
MTAPKSYGAVKADVEAGAPAPDAPAPEAQPPSKLTGRRVVALIAVFSLALLGVSAGPRRTWTTLCCWKEEPEPETNEGYEVSQFAATEHEADLTLLAQTCPKSSCAELKPWAWGTVDDVAKIMYCSNDDCYGCSACDGSGGVNW